MSYSPIRETETMSEQMETLDDSESRYATITLGSEDVLLYDREQPDAWLQSDYTVELYN